MNHWRDNLEHVTRYKPIETSYWHDVELCYDKMANSYCIVTEIRGMEGVVRRVSDYFATAFIEEFRK